MPHIHISVSFTLSDSMKKMMKIRLHRSVMVFDDTVGEQVT